MFKVTHTDLQNTGVLNPLVSDYLKRVPGLSPFYTFFPDLNGLSSAIQNADYSALDRDSLYKVLSSQASQVNNTSVESKHNIELLKQKNTFALTTGHQLCLFTGPLYFVYKIISCIKLAQELKEKFPSHNFVPVYWMAGEDHDFEEVNHFRLFGKTLAWTSSETGSVGDFSTSGLESILTQFNEIAGTSDAAKELSELFSEAYLKHDTLILATRYLVNKLFGKYGIVCIDGNEKEFKQQFKDILSEDIFENTSYEHVDKSIKTLTALSYSNQVKPRKINCFYIQKGLRARIEREGDTYKVIGTNLDFSEMELKKKLDLEPELFSPNVVLRPLFQQRILPNLAYVGGPGELAYWLQYKSMFEHYKIYFPVLVPRNFATVFEKPVAEKINKLAFTLQDVFLPEQKLIQAVVDRSGIKPDLENENQLLHTLFEKVQQKAAEVDKTLESAVKAELQKAIGGLQNIEAKMNRAIKQKSETEINQIKAIRQKVFPEEQPQERVDNFSQYYLKYGANFIDTLHKEFSALDFRHNLLVETS